MTKQQGIKRCLVMLGILGVFLLLASLKLPVSVPWLLSGVLASIALTLFCAFAEKKYTLRTSRWRFAFQVFFGVLGIQVLHFAERTFIPKQVFAAHYGWFVIQLTIALFGGMGLSFLLLHLFTDLLQNNSAQN